MRKVYITELFFHKINKKLKYLNKYVLHIR